MSRNAESVHFKLQYLQEISSSFLGEKPLGGDCDIS